VIVVDTNVVAFLAVEGEWSAKARRLVEKDTDWRIPSFWRYEMANVLSNYIKFKGMTLRDAKEVWERCVDLAPLHEARVAPDATLELSARYRITTYDALYVALALNLDTLCITGDRRLRKAVPACVRLLDEIVKE